jgi:hypothetical protein
VDFGEFIATTIIVVVKVIAIVIKVRGLMALVAIGSAISLRYLIIVEQDCPISTMDSDFTMN